jgi:hypothetical protein
MRQCLQERINRNEDPRDYLTERCLEGRKDDYNIRGQMRLIIFPMKLYFSEWKMGGSQSCLQPLQFRSNPNVYFLLACMPDFNDNLRVVYCAPFRPRFVEISGGNGYG